MLEELKPRAAASLKAWLALGLDYPSCIPVASLAVCVAAVRGVFDLPDSGLGCVSSSNQR
jgi:hypothetical protein